MKTLITSSLALIFTFLISVGFAQGTETRQVESFSKIKTGGSWNVYIQQGDREEVRLESKNIELSKIKTEVQGDELNVYLEKGNYNNVRLTVFITFRNLESLTFGGSGNLISEGDIVADELKVALGGSGDARFQDIRADHLSLKMSGSGNVHIAGGTVGELKVNQSGSGNFKGMNLQADGVNITKAGSGNTEITANSSLEVSSSGSGNIAYQGNPSINQVKIAGSGKLVKK
ncbi:head GIN domain-containing protein [Litoribacter populi]|uniref:head GIN domain-containing protein n=1 Tax=Litoribacter populi TaxID=2598460 RepID=UPI0011810348|nr:head GIN domain-containing protein [Litoribacter populi]